MKYSEVSIEILVIHVPLQFKDFSFNLLDFSTTRSLIQELADYEKMPNGPKISAQQLEEDGFGPHKYFHCKVAELEGEVHSYSDQTTIRWQRMQLRTSLTNEALIASTTPYLQLIGFALFFFTYSTWEGKSVFMEDLYVQPSHRGKGVGTKVETSDVYMTNVLHVEE